MEAPVLPSLFDLRGRVALVTGGRRGLGRAMAIGLAEAGVRVAVVARSSNPGDLPAEMERVGAEWQYLSADLSDRASRRGLVDKVVTRFGALDILINNAGAQRKAPAADYPLAQWDEDLELMLTAALDLSQQAFPHMVNRGCGRIIHIASISSFQGAREIIGYATAKHGIVGLTKCMANEWASHGINVNAIAPGLFETEMAAGVMADPVRSAELRGRIPSGRFGRPVDLVGPVLFLSSDASRHVHGTVLLVDGGWMGR